MISIIDDMITFFGSFILLIILAMVLGYCFEYQGGSNAIYPMLIMGVPPMHCILFQERM
jgi:hypothetical protein